MRHRLALIFTLCLVIISHVRYVHAKDDTAVGRRINTFALQDFRGKEWSLDDVADQKIVVVAFLGTECPLVKLYASRLSEMSSDFADDGVAFVGVNSNQQDSITEIAAFARRSSVTFPLLKDPANRVADQFQAARTPEVFVLDDKRVVRYHGRIDDQYTYGLQAPKAKRHHLREAIDELLAGKPVSVPKTETVGCHIGRKLEADETSDVTYANQISRIFQKRCVECHREGEIAPFSLTKYDDVVGWAEMIEEVVREQRMPPWHANPKHGDFANDASLSSDEKQLIYDWVDAGAPLGDVKQLPSPRTFTEGWRIGEPDRVIFMRDRPFDVKAEGEVRYQHFEVDPGFKEDTWVKSAECRPGNRAVVHHIIVAVKPPLGKGALVRHGIRSQWLAATAPGAQPLQLSEGHAKLIPAGSTLVFQLHYTPIGTSQQDRSSIGLIFADPKKVKKMVATQEATNNRFRIPPGADNHEVNSSYTFRKDSIMLTMFPHMHLRGKAFRYTAVYPKHLNREPEILLDVPAYDFNWQNGYAFAEPKLMPAGTRLKCVAHFDNSENNLANPDPTETVKWGDQTWEEMMIGYFDMVLADQDLTKEGATSRTQKFAERFKAGEIKVDAELKQLGGKALSSDEALMQFGKKLRNVLPQVDRVDWITVYDKKLHVELIAQELPIGRRKLTVPARGLLIPQYVGADRIIVNPDTTSLPTPDFQLMSKAFLSSVHVPMKHGDKEGVVSFWSQERKAFSKAAVSVIEEAISELR